MTGTELTNYNFALMKKKSELNRIALYQELRAFYENDYEEKIRIIKKYVKDKPFSEATLKRMWFQSIDFIQKSLNRKTAGILDGLVIKFADETDDTLLKEILEKIDFESRIHESLKKSEFFNLVIGQPIWRDEDIDFDLITGDECTVTTKEDYLKLDSIKLARVNQNGEVYYVFWNRDEHYIKDANGNEQDPTEDNVDRVNPYRSELDKYGHDTQFYVLRKREGLDFWGEPNWNLFLNQMASDLKLSDNERGEFYQKWNILFGDNTNLPKDFVIDPGMLIQAKDKVDSSIKSDLRYISPNIDWTAIRDNHESRQKQVLVSEGIPASSSSNETNDLSGEAKKIDEIELVEYRLGIKRRLKKYIKDAVEGIRIVYNYHTTGAKLPESEIVVDFKEVRTYETEPDKWLRRDKEYKYGMSNPIVWYMEEKGCSKEDAIAHFEDIQDTNVEYSFEKVELVNNLRQL